MNCEMARKELSLLLYGELSFEQEELLQQHLDGCAACRKELERERRLHSLARELELEPPPAMLAECRAALAGRLGELGPAGNPRRGFEFVGRLRDLLSRFRPAGMLWKPAAALGLVALGFFSARLAPPALPGARLGGLSEPVASRVRYVEPGPSGEVRIVLEETRQRVLSGRPGDSRIRGLLLAAATDAEDPGLRAESLEILRRQPGSDEVRAALIHALRRDPNPGVRLKALEGLRAFAGEPRTRRALAEALLEDDNPGVRTQAVDLLVEHKEREMVGVLQQLLLTEDNGYIRQRSQRALREMNASVETF